MTETVKNNWKCWGVWVGIIGMLAIGLFLRVYRLTDDLPYWSIGSFGAHLLDEGAYQLSAAHKAIYGKWQMPGVMYAGWTIRGYQLWIYSFFKFMGVTIFTARFACVAASTIGLVLISIFIKRSVSRSTLIAFVSLCATNYLLVMWSRIALPYSVTLLPASIILITSVLAIRRSSLFFSVLCGLSTFTACTFKESAILFAPIVLLFFIISNLIYNGFSFRRACFNKLVFSYLVALAVPLSLYYVFFLQPTSGQVWNESARDLKTVMAGSVQDTATTAQAGIKSSSKVYTWSDALSKLVFKFFGLKQVPFMWVLSVVGLLSFLKSPKIKKDEQYLINLFMILWAFVMSLGLIVLRYKGGLAVHWIPIYLVPFLYFAAYGFSIFWHARRNMMIVGVLLMGLAIGTDVWQYTNWLRQEPVFGNIKKSSQQIAQTIDPTEVGKSVLMIDSLTLFLREPKISTTYLRLFQLDELPSVVSAWHPQFVVIMASDNADPSILRVIQGFSALGFASKFIMQRPIDNQYNFYTYELVGKK